VTFEEVADAIVAAWGDEVTFPNLHQPPPASTTLLSDLAPIGVALILGAMRTARRATGLIPLALPCCFLRRRV